MAPIRILTIFGTRPEAIKLAPVVHALQQSSGIESSVCVTGQHREMLDQVTQLFDIRPAFDLDAMNSKPGLAALTSAVLMGVGDVISRYCPDWVIVQGDTTTAMAAALAAFYAKVKIAHVEAGLRTGNLRSPWPEEANRKLISQIAALHFAPTDIAAQNLRAEGIAAGTIHMVGNTVIDALHWVSSRVDNRADIAVKFPFLDPDKRLILVTGHRRENFETGLANMCNGLKQLAARGDVEIVYPVHLNPAVRTIADTLLRDQDHIHLIEPQTYLPFVYLMRRAYLIVTDSGGIQEEGPALGKPVLVTRDTTERPEAVSAGTARLIGTSEQALVAHASELLDHPQAYAAMAQAKNPFGDGKSSQRIVDILRSYGQEA